MEGPDLSFTIPLLVLAFGLGFAAGVLVAGLIWSLK